MKQNTLNGEFSLQGKGLHTGKAVTATFKPGAENTGYVIVRTDVEGCPEIPALAKYVEQADRASCLVKDGVKVFTLEHAMAALYGCGVDNCRVELDGEEFPILDGSARPYAEAIARTGLQEQAAERRYLTVKERMEFCSEDGMTRITVLPDDHYSISTVVDFDSPFLSMQYAGYEEGKTDFAGEIAPCRTFVFLREVEALLAHGLIKGGDLDNAIVIVDREVSPEEADAADEILCVTENYYAVSEVILTKDSSIQSKEDLEGKTVGSHAGSTSEYAVQSLADEGITVNSAPYNRHSEAFADLQNGNIDAQVVEDTWAEQKIKEADDIIMVEEPINSINMAGVIGSGKQEFTDAFNEAFAELQESGEYDEIVNKWFG